MIDLKTLNAAEKERIKELRDRLAGVIPQELEQDGSLYYRFLKARDFNVDKAEKMLRKHVSWRRVNQVDSNMKEFKAKEFYVKYVRSSAIGLNKDGDYVLYGAFGKVDVKDVLKCTTVNEYARHWIWEIEGVKRLQMQHSDQERQLYCQIHFIIDLDELTFSNATDKDTSEAVGKLLRLVLDNYPEYGKRIDIINAPTYYVILWSIIKVLLSRENIQKFQIYGESGWKERLLEKIDASVLPAFLGGTREDPDGDALCRNFVSHCGKIPSKLYIGSNGREFEDRRRVQRMTVPPSDAREVHLSVQEECSLIRWEILIRSKNIDFGLFYETTDERKEILPLHRISTPDGVERNYYRPELVGKYVFVFDNRYSWLNQKDIEYCFTVNPPD